MASHCFKCPLFFSFAAIALLLSLSLPSLSTDAGEVNADEIIHALKGRKTRSIKQPRPDALAFFQRLQKIRKTRGLTMQEREELYESSKGLPQINLMIFFNFDSDDILPESMVVLKEVAKALISDDLRGKLFEIAGHTDRKGNPDYNVDLSLRRAEAVKKVLVTNYGISPETLTTIGFGFEKLANKDDPYAAENRRVQFVRWTD